MKGVIVIGAGGHGREVAEALQTAARESNGVPLLGFVDDSPALHNKHVNGLPVLGGWDWLEKLDNSEIVVVCAVGSPEARRALVRRAEERSLRFHQAISPAAYVSPTAEIAAGAMILPHAVISSNCYIGPHAIVNSGATVSHDSRVESYGTINPGAHLAGNVSIGEGCFIGVGASLLNGVSIGNWSVIGGGATVIDDLPARVTAVGVPARIVRKRDEE